MGTSVWRYTFLRTQKGSSAAHICFKTQPESVSVFLFHLLFSAMNPKETKLLPLLLRLYFDSARRGTITAAYGSEPNGGAA